MSLSGVAAVLAAIVTLVPIVVCFVKKHQEQGPATLRQGSVLHQQGWRRKDTTGRFRAVAAQVHICANSGGGRHSVA